MEKVKNLVDLNTEIKSKKDAIVLITQDNCPKCEIIKSVIPMFEEQGDITKPLLVLNMDDEDVDREFVINKYDIMSTPVLIGFKDGEFKKKFEGDVTPMQLTQLELL